MQCTRAGLLNNRVLYRIFCQGEHNSRGSGGAAPQTLTGIYSGVATPGPARARARATYASARATELVLEHVANSVSIFLLVFIAKCLFRAVCLPSAAVKIRLLT